MAATIVTRALAPRATTWLAPAAAAIGLWSLAPTLAALATTVPPLQLTALCMVAAWAVTAPLQAWQRRGRQSAGPMSLVTLLTAAALMPGAVGFYLAALRHVPAAEAALIAYTWPLLFTVTVELLTTRRIRPGVLAGCVIAFGGAAAVMQPEGGAAIGVQVGHGLALASGLCWVGFSLLARQAGSGLNASMAHVFALAAALSLLGHGLVETALWPLPAELMIWIALIGAGPYGLAFVCWQAALRHGPGAVVGTLAYSVPVLSTGVLIAAGMAAFDWRLPLAAVAVALGCLLSLPRSPRQSSQETARPRRMARVTHCTRSLQAAALRAALPVIHICRLAILTLILVRRAAHTARGRGRRGGLQPFTLRRAF